MDIDRENYLQDLKINKASGGGIEIAAAANLYKIRICLHLLKNKKQIITFDPLDGKFEQTINLLYTGNHYQPCKY
jgi:hypothetical protein